MSEEKPRWFRFSLTTMFAVTLACGLWQVFVGLVIVPVLPHFQLDRVLNENELADDATRERTLAILKRAAGNQWFFWAAPGAIVSIISALGLCAANHAVLKRPTH